MGEYFCAGLLAARPTRLARTFSGCRVPAAKSRAPHTFARTFSRCRVPAAKSRRPQLRRFKTSSGGIPVSKRARKWPLRAGFAAHGYISTKATRLRVRAFQGPLRPFRVFKRPFLAPRGTATMPQASPLPLPIVSTTSLSRCLPSSPCLRHPSRQPLCRPGPSSTPLAGTHGRWKSSAPAWP